MSSWSAEGSRLLRRAQPRAPGIRTLIVCKGLVSKSGASIFAGNLVLAGRGLGNTEHQDRAPRSTIE
jgi:hypothetical protein